MFNKTRINFPNCPPPDITGILGGSVFLFFLYYLGVFTSSSWMAPTEGFVGMTHWEKKLRGKLIVLVVEITQGHYYLKQVSKN